MTDHNSESASMPRSLSLKNRERITKLFKSAKRRSGVSLTVFYRICVAGAQGNRSEINSAKWLVAIPKRTGNAVRRNRLRRALRETIRLWPKRGYIQGEVIVRYNAPRKVGKSNAKIGSFSATDTQRIATLRDELVGLLENIYSGAVGN